MRHLTPRARVLLAIAALAAAPVFAQSPTPAQPAADSKLPDVAKPACSKPEEHPGRLAADNRKKAWLRDVQVYVDCMKAYVNDQKNLADAHVAAANKTIEQLNREIAEFNEQNKAAAGM